MFTATRSDQIKLGSRVVLQASRTVHNWCTLASLVSLAMLYAPDAVQGGPCTPTVTITTQTSAQSACQGNTATFTVLASSTNGSPAFQWQVSTNGGASFNNVTTGTGANASSYTTAALALAENGNQYRVLIDDSTVCAVTSNTVGLTVNPLPDATPFVGTAVSTICAGDSSDIGVFGPQVGVNYQLRNSLGNTNVGNPVAGGGDAIILSTGPVPITTTFNVLATFVATGCSQQLTDTVTITVRPLPNASLLVGATREAICDGESTQVTVSGSTPGVNYQLRNNSGNTAVGLPVAGNGATIQLPTGALQSTTTFNVFATNITTGCAQQLSATQTITVTQPPDAGLAVGATSSTVCSGNSSTITVVASVVGVTYQLRNDADDTNVGGAVTGTGGTIELSTGILTATKTFNVLATVTGSTCAQQLSATQTITATNPPDNSLDLGATSSVVCAGGSTNVTVTGSVAGVGYQLRNNQNNALIGFAVGGTGGTISLPTGSITSPTTFNVLATANATGCVAELTDRQSVGIQTEATFKSQPANRSVCEGVQTEFSVEVEGSGLSFQWQMSIDGGGSFQDVTNGGTASTYKTIAAKVADNGNQYRLQVKDICGTYLSNAGSLTVQSGPTITKQPENKSANEGQNAAFAVVATGTGTLRYDWQISKDGGASFQDVVAGTGGHTATYITAPLAIPENGNQFRVAVSNECGTVVSRAAVLEVNAERPSPQPNPLCSVCGLGCSFGIAGVLGGLMTMRRMLGGARISRRRR